MRSKNCNLVAGSETSNFQVKFKVEGKNWGSLCMLIDGIQIGTTEEQVYLSPFFEVLKNLHDQVIDYDDSCPAFSDFELSNNISINTLLTRDVGMVALPPSFDDFIFRALPSRNGVYFYWKLVEAPFFKYDSNIHVDYKSFVLVENLELALKDWRTFEKNNRSVK